MKNIAILYLLAVTDLAALVVGDRYDFICNDGQDIYNAELVVEDAERYFVRLSPVMSRVPIEKKYVTKTIPRSVSASAKVSTQRAAWIFAGSGADISTGRLRSFSTFAPTGFLGGSWELTGWLSLLGRIDGGQFMNGSAYLRAIHIGLGGEIWLPVPLGAMRTYAGLTGGAALLTASSPLLSESSSVPSALAWFRVAYPLSGRLDMFATATARYVYDKDTLIISPGIFLGLAYRLFGT